MKPRASVLCLLLLSSSAVGASPRAEILGVFPTLAALDLETRVDPLAAWPPADADPPQRLYLGTGVEAIAVPTATRAEKPAASLPRPKAAAGPARHLPEVPEIAWLGLAGVMVMGLLLARPARDLGL